MLPSFSLAFKDFSISHSGILVDYLYNPGSDYSAADFEPILVGSTFFCCSSGIEPFNFNLKTASSAVGLALLTTDWIFPSFSLILSDFSIRSTLGAYPGAEESTAALPPILAQLDLAFSVIEISPFNLSV